MIDYFIGYDLFVEGNIFLVFLPENRRMRNVLLETGRLVLRKLEQGDFDEVCKLLQDPVVMYAYEGAFSDQEVQAWLDKMFRRYEDDGFALWAVIEKSSGELIGQCGITYQEYNGNRVPEVGYLFRKEFWHKGFATEAVIACKEYAFQELNFDEVYSIIRDSNGIPKRGSAEWNGGGRYSCQTLPGCRDATYRF